MVKYDRDCKDFKYYNENGEHEFIDNFTYEQAAKIICELMLCQEFKHDTTIGGALYMAMRKLQGFSDKDIQKLMN